MTHCKRPELPRRETASFYELPRHLQQLLDALYNADQAMQLLDSAEVNTREMARSDDPADRACWRWHQQASISAWRLFESLRSHAELAYIAWLTERAREDGRPVDTLLVERAAAEERMHAQLSRALAQEA